MQVKGDFFPAQINVATADVTNYLSIVSATNTVNAIYCAFYKSITYVFNDHHAVGTFGCIFKSLG